MTIHLQTLYSTINFLFSRFDRIQLSFSFTVQVSQYKSHLPTDMKLNLIELLYLSRVKIKLSTIKIKHRTQNSILRNINTNFSLLVRASKSRSQKTLKQSSSHLFHSHLTSSHFISLFILKSVAIEKGRSRDLSGRNLQCE